MKCATCTTSRCYTDGQNCVGISSDEVKALYDETDQKIMEAAAQTEGNFYNTLTRLEETKQFCEYMGYTHIGLVFCIGLREEARLVHDYLSQFFTVTSAVCKIGATAKSDLELTQVKEGIRESMCNPIVQAQVLNDAHTEFNISMGLCVGHDALFNKHSEAPVTVLIAKDRVLAHNPAGVLYSRYWRKKLGIHDGV